MAKKTNKTNHVLNLLSGADEQDAEVKKATEETEPKIQIVNQNQEDSIAADVQQMLEEELLQEEQTLQAQREKETEWQTEAAAADAAASVPAAESASAAVSDAETAAVPAASAADHAETAAPADTLAEADPDSAETAAQPTEPESAAGEAGVSAEAAAAETAAAEADMNTEEAAASETDTTPAEAAASGTDANTAADAASEVDRNTAEAATAPAASAAETAHETPLSDVGQPQAAPAATSPEPAAAEPEVPSYALLNVMERLVDDKLDYYMKKFDVCTCPRCRVDVKALALSHMEAKYVVLDKSGISAFLSLYTNKYASEVMFHLGKACMQVLESPRH